MTQDDHKLHILICIGGGPEAFTGLKFVHRLGKERCIDIKLLYVRPMDSGFKSGGMEVKVARENVLDWGIELPSMTHLNKARDILVELGEIDMDAGDEWRYRELTGDPAGEFVLEYQAASGGKISLALRMADDVTSVVVDEADRMDADFIIVGGSAKPVEGLRRYLTPKDLAMKISSHSDHSVLIARKLEPGLGYIVCVQDTDVCWKMLPKAIRYSITCDCPISLLAVAEDEEGKASAQKAVEKAAEMYRQAGMEPHELLVEIGDPADIITEIGYDFSLIIMAESEKPWFAKVFSVAHEVAAKARNSVLIIK
ncbi:universal stress protein [Pseudodesulfovibrio piezophilus]|uniref:UspA domain protein n=1 Tax=Pseudodesulfovibrio piezophilus (strain DSM 21447 / JCM 15486 / C1TLV30) TaxID=1322246 RepID=M1WTF8_PSEP2|nr:universal stress protein [Pseudodesulfovibrio piezophilus]CCH49537.1 UspA domain protein [Pseudodesulfovibrio piezophilus C1TLV30]